MRMGVVVLLVLAGCAQPSGDAALYGTQGIDGGLVGTLDPDFIRQAGSSTVLPIASAWAQDFATHRGITILVSGGGSGAGAAGICEGRLDIGDMSRAMKPSEHAACEAAGVDPVAWTVAYDGLSIVVSHENAFAQDLTVAQLRQAFVADGAATWQDVDPAFPAEPIQRCAPDAGSGTWDYFDEVILDGAPLAPSAQRSADDNALVQCVAQSPAAIGFFGYAYLQSNDEQIRSVAVNGIHPSPETIADNSYAPLSRPIFMVTDGVPAAGSILRDYLNYGLHPDGGQRLVADVGYVALDEPTQASLQAMLG
ncbi:MAG: phosphate ABC transporter substrate-binding protein PstS family protein [Thermoplasmatota archaeon]